MLFKKRCRKEITPNNNETENEKTHEERNEKINANPYLIGALGKKEWNDRYMNLSLSIRNWQMAFAASMLVTLICAGIVAKIASESRVEPFIVETTHGIPYSVAPMAADSLQDQKLINFAVNQFIMNARTILSDPTAQKAVLNKVYAYSANETLGYLKDYFMTNNPYDEMGKHTVSVEIVNSMPLSKSTWQITWDEMKRDIQTGEVVSTTRWMGNVTYKFGEVNQKFINENPFGFYVTNVSWSKSI